MLCPSCVIGIIVVWWWCCCHRRHWHRHRHHLCTALPVTALIIETSYLAIYAAIPLVYAYDILCQCDVYFLNGSHFSKFLLSGSPVYMVKLKAFIFGTVMHLYWGYPQGRNYTPINNILKVMNF